MSTARARWPICAAAFLVNVTTAVLRSRSAPPSVSAMAARRSEIAVVLPEPALALTAKLRAHSSRKRSRAAWSGRGSLIGGLLPGCRRGGAERDGKFLLQDRAGNRGTGQRPGVAANKIRPVKGQRAVAARAQVFAQLRQAGERHRQFVHRHV